MADGGGQLALSGLVDAHALGLAGNVTVSHAFALSEVLPPRLDWLVEGLAGQRISLTTVAR